MKKCFFVVWLLSIVTGTDSIISPEIYKVNHMIYNKYTVKKKVTFIP